MDPRAVLVALEKRKFCLNRKLNPRLSVTEASIISFSLSQFGAVGLRTYYFGTSTEWQDETIVPWHFTTFVKETSILGGGSGGGAHGRDEYTPVFSWNSGEVS